MNSLMGAFLKLSQQFNGELYYNESSEHEAQRLVYSTDASVYQEKPAAVSVPKDDADLKLLIAFANEHKITLVPRAAGTSLAGQVVSNGIIVDISKYFKKVIEINAEEKWVRIQPGIVRDDLNVILKPYGLMFGPETSTSNRAMIGGMIGNNSSGLHSISWGDTRQHLLEAKVYLSNGDLAEFKALTEAELQQKLLLDTLEGSIYREINALVSDENNVSVIEKNYPKKSLTRRNTGYALDFLIRENKTEQSFNFCKLLAGSEGTLAFVTEAKLNLLPIPPAIDNLVCVHFTSLQEALRANLIILKHNPLASELVDRYIMDFTKGHATYQHNRFFIEGEPEALLMAEFMSDDAEQVRQRSEALIADLKLAGLGYAYPVLSGNNAKLAWDVRKAGLGLIRNLPGDKQPVNLIEDCAVSPEDLPDYIADLQALLARHELHASYYAHAGAGELHVEPMIDLKTTDGQALFRTVLQETAVLVKKYNGSLSGEHGDGRLRGEFIPFILGNEVYELLKQVKNCFDPARLFNAGKIVDTPAMNTHLRYQAKHKGKVIPTIFDFTKQEGILRLTEKCSGSGDCRKTHVTGGTMCPSYMATLQEKDTTRARANILRQFLSGSEEANPYDHKEVKEVMDLCLSCKGCKSECPSSVDVAKMKAEFLQHYYDANGVPMRAKMIGNFTKMQQLAMIWPSLYNFVIGTKFTGNIIKKIAGFAPKRSLPEVGKQTLRSWKKEWDKRRQGSTGPKNKTYKVNLFCDEFTNYNDVEIGKTTIKLLTALGYEVIIPNHLESGRTYLSKGLLRKAKQLADENIRLLADVVTSDAPLIGIEPSAILTFRDEYPDLASPGLLDKAKALAKNAFTLEEFLTREVAQMRVIKQQFTTDRQLIKLHGHCYQKALNALAPTQTVLSLPENYTVELIPSGCCGMAGSFGYEEEHYDVSMKIGELVLFPAVRSAAAGTIIAAAGTSCRHQVKDGTSVKALHPAEILWNALADKTIIGTE